MLIMELPAVFSPSMTILVLIAVLILIMFTSLIFNNKLHILGHRLHLPPSPPNKLPILGHLHQLGGPHPQKNLQILAKKHGPDLMLLHLGHAPTLVVSSAKAARDILKTHDLVFSSRPTLEFATTLTYGGKGLTFASYMGEYWRQIRRICILQLLSTKRVQSFRAAKEEETAVMMDKISLLASTGDVVNLSKMLMTYTSDLICRVAFGKKYSGEEIGGRFGELLLDLTHIVGAFNVADYIPWLGWVNHFNGLNGKVEKTSRELDDFLERVVEEHVRRKEMLKRSSNGGGDGGDEEDLLDVLLGIGKDGSLGVSLGRDNIKAVILDMFAAGTDTSHALLEWTMTELLRHPEIMKEVQKEVREVGRGNPSIAEEDLDKMQYLQLVIKETLRLHPPATLLLPRESSEVVKLQGYDIPAKTRVIINAWAIGRDPDSWSEPEKFEPKRFLNSPIDYKGQHFELIPFGAGRRGCPGILFATSTIELGLANLLYRYDWALPDGAIEDELDMAESGPGVVTHKKSPLLLVATHHHHHYT